MNTSREGDTRTGGVKTSKRLISTRFLSVSRPAPAPADGFGRAGPAVNGDILRFLRSCSVHGNVGKLAERNDRATETRPVSYRKLFTGLHLETDRPEQLLALVC